MLGILGGESLRSLATTPQLYDSLFFGRWLSLTVSFSMSSCVVGERHMRHVLHHHALLFAPRRLPLAIALVPRSLVAARPRSRARGVHTATLSGYLGGGHVSSCWRASSSGPDKCSLRRAGQPPAVASRRVFLTNLVDASPSASIAPLAIACARAFSWLSVIFRGRVRSFCSCC